MTNRWSKIDNELREAREKHVLRLTEVQSTLISRLLEIVKLECCDAGVQGWFTTTNNKLTLSDAAPARVGKWPAIPLKNLEHIDDALLTISITFERKRLKEYSIQLLGTRRIDPKLPWYARVDLDESGKGVGLCSHAMLHTHVGTKPDDDHIPSNDPKEERKRFGTRVATPWLDPIDALNWLLATVDRRLEPIANAHKD